MPSIVYVKVSKAEREARLRGLLRALKEYSATLLRARAYLAAQENDSVVKEQTTNNSLSQTEEVVAR